MSTTISIKLPIHHPRLWIATLKVCLILNHYNMNEWMNEWKPKSICSVIVMSFRLFNNKPVVKSVPSYFQHVLFNLTSLECFQIKQRHRSVSDNSNKHYEYTNRCAAQDKISLLKLNIIKRWFSSLAELESFPFWPDLWLPKEENYD